MSSEIQVRIKFFPFLDFELLPNALMLCLNKYLIPAFVRELHQQITKQSTN